ncbi:polysaccharide biosynthesis/export family protein, partial [Staphylococcus haemolyticus]|uniref:polysaccharide biosynthesis/export family protein n=1 Tax=Staphylococcus haemolyticus TaxID=1283 RepID=UPI0039898A50
MNPTVSLRLYRSAAQLLAIMAVLLLQACGTTSSHPPAPQVAETPDHRYKIGALDTLNIVVWRNPELSATVTVRPDGRISHHLVEDVMAAGRSPADLSREGERALAKFIRDPVVT